MDMSEPAGAAGPPIPAEVLPRLTAAAAQFAARYEEANPASILAVATTRAKALEVVFKGTRGGPGSEAVQVHAVVMTGRFASYRGGPDPREQLPLVGSALVVVLDAQTLAPLDVRLGDQDDPALLSSLGPVITLKGQ
jgi:hypothetical protein